MSLTNQSITPFDFQGKEVRTVVEADTPWFVVKDICQILEIAQPSRAVANHPADEVSQIHITDALGRWQKTTVVNEAGLYRLIFRSDKSEAESFRKWVFADVLPTIRKTGGYQVQQPSPPATLLDALEQTLATLRTQDRRLELLEGGHVELEARLDDQPISAHADKRNHIYALVHELGSTLGGTYHVGLTWRRFKAYFNLSKYDALPVKRYDEAVALLKGWLEKAKQGDGLFN